LNEALSKERELVDMKSRFVSIASHEFRTPLSTISVATGILLKHKDKLTGEEVTSKLKNIEKQVEHMTYMLDDVLLVEKSNSGKLTVQRKLIEVLPFFTSLASEVERSTGGSHHIVVQNNLLLPTMMSDEKLLRSIAINLLTNAIKFSPGTHRVDLTLSTDADDFVLKVKDFGIGIPEPDIKNLFEPFFRGGNVSTIQGTGLGLSIIKKSLDLLHGTIKVKSKLGEGTEITIAIPLQDE
jgi:signal transduction histidine kinase